MAATVVLDLEGTLYTREAMIPGALCALADLRAAGHRLVFATNTDSVGTDQVFARMRNLGIPAQVEELFTPVVAARRLLADHGDATAFVLGSPEVGRELATVASIVPAGPTLDRLGDVTHVVVGDVRDGLDYQRLDAAFAAVFAGAQLIALHKGRFFLSGGQPHVDTGAVVAAIEYAAGAQARVVGKPSVDFLHLALGELPSTSSADLWVVGDDRTSDIALARTAGVHSVLVRTGKYALQAHDEGLPLADAVIDSIAELPNLLRGH